MKVAIAVILLACSVDAETNSLSRDVPMKTLHGQIGQTVTAGTVTKSDTKAAQWYKDGRAIKGATNETFVLYIESKKDAGVYSVKGTNSTGVSTDAFLLTVREPDHPKPKMRIEIGR